MCGVRVLNGAQLPTLVHDEGPLREDQLRKYRYSELCQSTVCHFQKLDSSGRRKECNHEKVISKERLGNLPDCLGQLQVSLI